MEEALETAKEACTDRVGEAGLGRQIAGNVRDLLINDSVASIEAATKAVPVCEELKEHTDNERVASAALNKLYDLIQLEGRNGEKVAGIVLHFASIEDMLSVDAIEPVLASMLNHGENESIQVRGCRLLGAFTRDNRNEAHVSLLVSARCVQAICSAMERFPDSKEVQGAALSTVFPIQQRCQFFSNLETLYFTNLANANALNLALSALENHSDDYHSVSGALTVFHNLANGAIRDQHILQVARSFFASKPDLQTLIANAVETQQALYPDDIYIERDAFFAKYAIDLLLS